MPDDIRHPSPFTDTELLQKLRTERVNLLRQLSVANAELRKQAAMIAGIEDRLHNIETSEDYLSNRSEGNT